MISREFLSQFSFRVFRETDYFGFAGVMSPVPLIAENDQFVVIIDGGRCEVYGDTDSNGGFDLIAECDDVNELPL